MKIGTKRRIIIRIKNPSYRMLEAIKFIFGMDAKLRILANGKKELDVDVTEEGVAPEELIALWKRKYTKKETFYVIEVTE
ncbi:hypothetical protein DNHGIG_40500 [Collibacillus ludicampi]|uniref:Ferredoxin n=1 Tax=Collibacillus ludicampi TaxID=2771369 RepID=A0AAV4LL58_9BACL|nr:hypothetical protein [Collibacillus ludicampi]GIM48501.1 hypothetical protein DNHGIG_40500 [Collibacillus ludicampi]